MMEAATMPTVCLRFRFEEHPKIRALMEACADIQRQAVDYALENGKTATFTIIQALYPSLRERYPHLHSQLIYGAIRSGARIVHGFRNQQRRGKTQADRPEIRRPSVYLVRQTVKIEWDGETLTVTIPVSPRDPEPIVLTFRPHHKYRRLLDEWKAGRARMGEPTLTAHSLSIPLKFPDPIPYKPEGVIGIDRNEGNLTAFVTSTGEIREIDTRYVGKVNRDHLRREIKGTRGKHNPKAKKKIASKHRRIRRSRRQRTLASSGPGPDRLGAGDAGGPGAGGSQGDEGADWEGEVQEDAAAFAELLEHYDLPPDSGSQGEVLRGSGDLGGSAEHVPGVSGMRQGK
jgi:transposase